MIKKWLKKVLGKKSEPLILTNPIKYEDEVKVTERPSKPKPTKTKAKKSEVNLDSMKKPELLAYAKKNGIKANASMNKAALISKINDGK